MTRINFASERAISYELCLVAFDGTGRFHALGKKPSLWQRFFGTAWIKPHIYTKAPW